MLLQSRVCRRDLRVLAELPYNSQAGLRIIVLDGSARPFQVDLTEMSPMKCPGQDRSCWTGEPVREIPCPECGAAVEDFPGRERGPLPSLRSQVFGPGGQTRLRPMVLGGQGVPRVCTPAGVARRVPPESALAARLIQRVEQVFKNDPARIAHALRVFQFAKELVREEGGDPRVVLCASLLLATGGESNSQPDATSVEEVLREMGLDEATLKRVLQIVTDYRTGQNMEAVQLRIVCDAEKLARLGRRASRGQPRRTTERHQCHFAYRDGEKEGSHTDTSLTL